MQARPLVIISYINNKIEDNWNQIRELNWKIRHLRIASKQRNPIKARGAENQMHKCEQQKRKLAREIVVLKYYKRKICEK